MSDKEIINVKLSDDGTAVVILDQTALPNETKYITLKEKEELYEAIYTLRVRGAPAIGIFAAYALYVLAKQLETEKNEFFVKKINELSAYLDSSRPTAVNLGVQLRRMTDLVEKLKMSPVKQIVAAMKEEAITIYNEDVEMCKAISKHGMTLIKNGDGILTQCNAGPIATSKYGTGLGPIIMGQEHGMNLKAYICETRPLLQGARLTAYELVNAGVDSTLICDNMASIIMSQGKINAVFAGCDRIARNGDAANKVGTSSLAILAKHYGIPLYIFAPSTTIDKNCPTGKDIEIEERNPEEIKEMFYRQPMAPKEVKAYNPAFDVTPNELITAIVTETGIHRPGGL